MDQLPFRMDDIAMHAIMLVLQRLSLETGLQCMEVWVYVAVLVRLFSGDVCFWSLFFLFGMLPSLRCSWQAVWFPGFPCSSGMRVAVRVPAAPVDSTLIRPNWRLRV